MKMTNRTRLLSLILCVVLTWTAALITGCTDNTPENPADGTTTAANAVGTTVATTAETTAATTAADADPAATELGEGSTVFSLTVADKDGVETSFTIKTDKTTVGDALTELGLIEGEEGAYGLYIKKANGITADYDVDGTYWAFYINGEYAMTGVDATDIEDGAAYALKVEK